MTTLRSSTRVRDVAISTVFVGVMALTWLLAAPPNAGPDEPGHVIRAAALVRGQLDGQPSEFTAERVFDLPAWVGAPDPACYAFQPYSPATCATSLPRPGDEEVPLASRAGDYPVWGHLLPGIGTLLPAAVAPWAARALDAIAPVLLVGAAITAATRQRGMAAAATLLAVTPMAWFSFAVVNPSGLAIAGGVALWAGFDALRREPAALHRWLVGLGWTALVLPRRDGLVWAALIVSVWLLLSGDGLLGWWRRLAVGPQLLVVGSTLATLTWAATSDTTSSDALLLVPALPFVAVGGRWLWQAPWLATVGRRTVAVILGAAVGVAVAYLLMDRRPTGFDREVFRLLVGRTGLHLDEAIGVLGWLDAPIPDTMRFLWLVLLGMLAAASVAVGAWRRVAAATIALLLAIAASWVLEMAQGDPTGTYWQGRYYLPMLVGVPMVLGQLAASTGRESAALDRLALVVGPGALVIVNVALAAAMRRWGVGLAGSFLPWDWDTYDTFLPPVALLVVHAAASVGLWWWCRRLGARSGDRRTLAEAAAV